MTEFIVVRAVRRRGVGHEVAAELAAGPVREERRPVPGKPHLPPDVWLLLTV